MDATRFIFFMLTVTILILTIIIALLMWLIWRRNKLLERRWEVLERETLEVDKLKDKKVKDDLNHTELFSKGIIRHSQLTDPFRQDKQNSERILK